ncbi:MAG: o-succinylbenzoate synthase [Chloroflexota bacterium]
MKIDRIELHQVALPLVHPFRTSFGEQTERHFILASVYADGVVGWCECTAHTRPDYSYEDLTTSWHVIEDYLAPGLIGKEINEPADIFDSPGYKMVRGHNMAKATIENAVWDLLARAQDKPLQAMFGGTKDRIEVGVSIGIQPTLQGLLDRVDSFVEEGYGRIKMKIEPGWELEPLTKVRERHPDIKLMADANSAFRIADADLFNQMESLNLLMIEQPLAHDDIIDHATLQANVTTPICLDESIHGLGDARMAIALKACEIINVKVGRVSGLTEAIQIHDVCAEANIPVWSGGMLETGVGRAINLHMASLPNFTLPSDLSATKRYYHEDIAEPAFELNPEDSTIKVPVGPGSGIEVQQDRLEKNRERHTIIK